MTVTLYEVGGCVRDDLLGVKTKDIDFTAVVAHTDRDPFEALLTFLEWNDFEIFLKTPQYFTIRARFPRRMMQWGGRDVKGVTADFVIARKEGDYTDGRRPDEVAPGTLLDDLARRDFTVNAIAKDSGGRLIDPFGGEVDLRKGLLRAVGDAEARLREDALRALRAVRFAVTKGFSLDEELADALRSEWLPPLLASVSAERRREEMRKAFRSSTVETFEMLMHLPAAFREAVFADGLWLEPTLKE